MTPIHTIVAATDFSPGATAAVDRAGRLDRATGWQGWPGNRAGNRRCCWIFPWADWAARGWRNLVMI